MKVKYTKLAEEAVAPTKGSAKAAGFDLYALHSAEIEPHSTTMVRTGIAIELPDDTFGAIFARSGLASKEGLRPANCVGVVDSDYRGEIMVALHNDTNMHKCISKNDRIAQLVVVPHLTIVLEEEDDLTVTERGEGGFGSTGK